MKPSAAPPYIIPAMPTTLSWRTYSPAELAQQDQKRNAHREAIVKILSELFAPYPVSAPRDADWANHWVSFPEAGSTVNYSITDNGFLQFTLQFGYIKKLRRQVKMVRNGDVWELDAQKLRAATKAILDERQRYNDNQKRYVDALVARRAAEVEAFAKVRPALEAKGVVFSSVGDGGGTVLLSTNISGPRIEVLGDTVILKLSQYGSDRVSVGLAAIPAFVATFESNETALASPNIG